MAQFSGLLSAVALRPATLALIVLCAMTTIDSRLAKDEERTLRRAVNVCYQIYDKKSAADLRAFTQREFETGPAKVSAKKARKIVTATKKWICSRHALYLRWQT